MFCQRLFTCLSHCSLNQCNPPLVLGPIVHYLRDLDSLNTSNQRIRDIMIGKARQEIAPTGTFLWADVRDLALAHVRAAERPEAAGKRFFITAGHFSNKEIANIIRDSFPDLDSKLPTKDTKGGDYPEDGWSRITAALFALVMRSLLTFCRGVQFRQFANERRTGN